MMLFRTYVHDAARAPKRHVRRLVPGWLPSLLLPEVCSARPESLIIPHSSFRLNHYCGLDYSLRRSSRRNHHSGVESSPNLPLPIHPRDQLADWIYATEAKCSVHRPLGR